MLGQQMYCFLRILKNFLKLFEILETYLIFATMSTVKLHRSKYNFGSLKEVGESIAVEPQDVYSALSSLNSFNKRHGTSIVMEPDGQITEDGKIKLFVIEI